MKELTIEEKARAYDEAINVIKNLVDTGVVYENVAIRIFPALEQKENDDEKIRKSLLEYLHTLPNHYACNGICAPEWLAWLEKQGEQKPTVEMKTPEESLGIDSETYNKIVDECIYGDDEQKPAE